MTLVVFGRESSQKWIVGRIFEEDAEAPDDATAADSGPNGWMRKCTLDIYVPIINAVLWKLLQTRRCPLKGQVVSRNGKINFIYLLSHNRYQIAQSLAAARRRSRPQIGDASSSGGLTDWANAKYLSTFGVAYGPRKVKIYRSPPPIWYGFQLVSHLSSPLGVSGNVWLFVANPRLLRRYKFMYTLGLNRVGSGYQRWLEKDLMDMWKTWAMLLEWWWLNRDDINNMFYKTSAFVITKKWNGGRQNAD